MTMTTTNPFFIEYRKQLAIAVEKYTEEYPWARPDSPYHQTVDQVADRMIAAIKRGSYSYDGRAFKATCKALGIKHTYKAIAEYIAANDPLEK